MITDVMGDEERAAEYIPEMQGACEGMAGGMGTASTAGNLEDHEAQQEILRVFEDPGFNQYAELARSSGYNMPLDLPKVAAEWIRDRFSKRLQLMDGAKEAALEEQQQKLQELFDRAGLDDQMLHQQANTVLGQTQGKVKGILDEVQRIQDQQQRQHILLENMYQQNQMQLQWQNQMAAGMQMAQMGCCGLGGGPMGGSSMGYGGQQLQALGGMGDHPPAWNGGPGSMDAAGSGAGRGGRGMGGGGGEAEIVIDVPEGPVVSFIIGKSGASIRMLESQSDCRIQVANATPTSIRRHVDGAFPRAPIA